MIYKAFSFHTRFPDEENQICKCKHCQVGAYIDDLVAVHLD
jgi:hypothetical protein